MKKWQGIAAFAAAGLIAMGCGAGSKVAADPNAKQAAPATSAVKGAAATKATTGGDTAPTTKDFTLSVKTTKKQCFGSAGCNVEYHIEVASSWRSDGDKEYTVTYEVSGVEDGPQVNSFTITGDGKYSRDEVESASTKSTSAKLRAKVTDVEQD